MKAFQLLLVVPLLLITSFDARADLEERCRYDQLRSRSQAQGRNLWAQKCGYIKSSSMIEAMNAEGTYMVFTNGRLGGGNGGFNVPAEVNAPCIQGLEKQGFCYSGCYTPDQRLQFLDEELAIAQAYASQLSQVTALSTDSRRGSLVFSEQKVKSYIKGKTNEKVLTLTTADNHRLTVTREHPMVSGRGEIVKASQLKVGDTLLSANGETATLTEISEKDFSGDVWNIRPHSQLKQENIIIAAGLLSGSHRFQTQWSDEVTRLYFRSEADISGL
jgi:hypothetical protein